jgi:hypothetical protein
MKRYEIRENKDQTVTQHEVISAMNSREALQLADIPAEAKSWSCESASGQPAEDDFCLFDPRDEYHSWSAELGD